MKYIKLFENFHGEDPKWIVTSALDPIEVEEVPFDEKYKDTSMFKVFDLSSKPDEDKLNHLKSWLEDEGYHLKDLRGKFPIDRIVVTNKPFMDACMEWLNTNYSKIEVVDSKEYPALLFRWKAKDNIMFYRKPSDLDKGRLYVRDEIWLFFTNNFLFGRIKTSEIIEKWVGDTFNLKDISIIRLDDSWELQIEAL